MAYSILSPRNSFVQFNEDSTVTSCNFPDISLCLPVVEDQDVAFQFVIETETKEEADALCDLLAESVVVGISDECAGDTLLDFEQKPDRFRLSDTQVLYNWGYGVPGFSTITPVGGCFFIRVSILGYNFCSNCFQRIADDCHTSVLEYGNDDDAFGFNYCNSVPVEGEGTGQCEPRYIPFSNESTLNIPYTAELQDKYGEMPTIATWIYNPDGVLQRMNVFQGMDTFPPNMLMFDFGGPSSGVIKIS